MTLILISNFMLSVSHQQYSKLGKMTAAGMRLTACILFMALHISYGKETIIKSPYETNKPTVMLSRKSSNQTAGPYSPDWGSLDSRPIPTWFDEAKFGIFIVWVCLLQSLLKLILNYVFQFLGCVFCA